MPKSINASLEIVSFFLVKTEPVFINFLESFKEVRIPIKFEGIGGRVASFDSNNEVRMAFKWSSELNEIQMLSEAQEFHELCTPASGLTHSVGCLNGMIIPDTGVYENTIEWMVLRGSDYEVLAEHQISMEIIISARREA